MRMMRSSGPQPAVAGSFALVASVMSMPMTAKSPLASSQMSGQLQSAIVCLPFSCGSGPILRTNSRSAFIPALPLQRRGEKARTKYSAYTVVHICGFGFHCKVVKIPKYRKVLGENIRTHRRNLKWSQEKLAEKADLHHNYIGDIERGEENVSVDALKRITTALKIRLSDLMRGV
jgi:DNA-binding XRE family transcriptional regulator